MLEIIKTLPIQTLIGATLGISLVYLLQFLLERKEKRALPPEAVMLIFMTEYAAGMARLYKAWERRNSETLEIEDKAGLIDPSSEPRC